MTIDDVKKIKAAVVAQQYRSAVEIHLYRTQRPADWNPRPPDLGTWLLPESAKYVDDRVFMRVLREQVFAVDTRKEMKCLGSTRIGATYTILLPRGLWTKLEQPLPAPCMCQACKASTCAMANALSVQTGHHPSSDVLDIADLVHSSVF